MTIERRYTRKDIEPKPYEYLIIVADDEDDQVLSNARNVEDFSKSNPNINAGVLTADNIGDLFHKVFDYLDGSQADALLLDNNYIQNEERWNDPKSIIEFIDSMGLSGAKGLNEWCKKITGTKLAILFRACGFTGKIYSVSNDPDEVRIIHLYMQEFENITGMKQEFPFNGYILKKPLSNKYMFYSDGLNEKGEWRNLEIVSPNPHLSQVLDRLLS